MLNRSAEMRRIFHENEFFARAKSDALKLESGKSTSLASGRKGEVSVKVEVF
jgi:hypothetical protein